MKDKTFDMILMFILFLVVVGGVLFLGKLVRDATIFDATHHQVCKQEEYTVKNVQVFSTGGIHGGSVEATWERHFKNRIDRDDCRVCRGEIPVEGVIYLRNYDCVYVTNSITPIKEK